jgi:hypothetical protein
MTGTGGAALTTGTDNILIGSNARPTVATGTYQIVIGNSLVVFFNKSLKNGIIEGSTIKGTFCFKKQGTSILLERL